MTSATNQSQIDALLEQTSALPGVDVETDDEGGVRLEFTIPDFGTAIRLEWPSLVTLGLPALAIVISAVVQLIMGGADTAAQVTVLIFVAPVLLIMACALVYRRRTGRRLVRLSEDTIEPGPWMLAQGGEHVFTRPEIIRLELVRRSDTLTRLTHGHIVVETAFHRSTFGAHLKDHELEVLWRLVSEVTGMESISIPWQRMVAFSFVVGLFAAAATFLGLDAFSDIESHPQLLHAFAALTVGAVIFGLMLGAWRRQQPTLQSGD